MRNKLALLFLALTLLLAACSGSSNDANESASSNDNGSDASGELEELTISIGQVTPANEDSHFHQFIKKFGEELEALSDGKMTIQEHPNGELGGEREMIEAVQLGNLDAVLTGAGPLGNFTPLTNVLDFPFLFEDREHAFEVVDGEFGDLINEEMEKQNLKILTWGDHGFRNITSNGKPITKPEDLKGFKIRTQENEIHLQTFTDYGANPTPMAFTEVYSALQQGVIDGQENPLSVIVPNNVYEVQDHVSLTGHFYQGAAFIINKELFDGLSQEAQDIVMQAAEAAREHQRAFTAEQEDNFIQFLEDNGITVVYPDEIDREAFLEASENVYAEYEDEFGEYLEQIRAMR